MAIHNCNEQFLIELIKNIIFLNNVSSKSTIVRMIFYLLLNVLFLIEMKVAEVS